MWPLLQQLPNTVGEWSILGILLAVVATLWYYLREERKNRDEAQTQHTKLIDAARIDQTTFIKEQLAATDRRAKEEAEARRYETKELIGAFERSSNITVQSHAAETKALFEQMSSDREILRRLASELDRVGKRGRETR